MADVVEALAKRNYEAEWCKGWDTCPEYARPGWIEAAQETLDFLSAAGFGPVRDSAAAGIRSVCDVWGAGGRATVRLSELTEIAKNTRAGEWDQHIAWNLGDIAREKARAAREAGNDDQ